MDSSTNTGQHVPETERIFASLLAHWYWQLDEHLHYVFHDGSREPLSAARHEELIGVDHLKYLARCGLDQSDEKKHREQMELGEWVDVTFALCPRGDEVIHIQIVARPIVDRSGKVTGYHGCGRDISDRVIMERRLLYLANHDDLTGIYNRREFHARMERLNQYVQGTDYEFSLCVLDLDRFKLVNDTAGHAAGDQLLIELVDIVQGYLDVGETLARLGGDEFALLLESPSEWAAARGRRMIAAISSHVLEYDNRFYSVGACMGITPIAHGSDSVEELCDRADSACYAAKKSGRNQCVVFAHDSADYLAYRQELEQIEIIKEALQANRLRLFAQSIEPGTQKVLRPHYEILLRLQSERGELMEPSTFIPVAERFNIMQDLDKGVLELCLETLHTFRAGGHEISLSINLSGNTLSDLSALDTIIKMVVGSSVNGDQLCFEITESAAISNIDNVVCFMKRLKREGVRFALDDFGAGLSSFGYIRSLPIDFLKIDGYFIRNIRSDPTNRAITAAFVQLSRELGIKTVAEFVEDKATRNTVVDMGIDYVQGYGVARPVPVAHALAALKSNGPDCANAAADRKSG